MDAAFGDDGFIEIAEGCKVELALEDVTVVGDGDGYIVELVIPLEGKFLVPLFLLLDVRVGEEDTAWLIKDGLGVLGYKEGCGVGVEEGECTKCSLSPLGICSM